MTTFYLDYEGGSDAADGTTFANRWKTFAGGATAARIGPADVIRVMASPTETLVGNATWTQYSKTVTLAAAVTLNISDCETAWTGVTNTTVTASTTVFKEGSKAMSCVVASAFTTGKAAYFATGTLDLSAYQQVCFWVRATVALAAGTLSLRLCSDIAGATTVHTLAIPALPATNTWLPVVVDTGSALNSAIASVALYCDTDPATVTVWVDNVNACKAPSSADALTLHSLVGKAWNASWAPSTAYALGAKRRPSQPQRNGLAYQASVAGTSGAAEPGWPLELGATVVDGTVTWTAQELEDSWYAIQSINGSTVKLDNELETIGSAGRGYAGASETVATYKREPIVATSGNTITDSGNVGLPIVFTGGWDRTAMTTQSGETWFSGHNTLSGAAGIHPGANNYLNIINLNLVRFDRGGIGSGGAGGVGVCLFNCHWNNNGAAAYNATAALLLAATGCAFRNNGQTSSNAAFDAGVGGAALRLAFTRVALDNNLLTPWRPGAALALNMVHSRNNGGVGASINSATRAYGLVTANNSGGGVEANSTTQALANALIGEGTAFVAFNTLTLAGLDPYIFSHKHNQVADAHLITADGGTIAAATDQRHTASGISWKFSPTSITRGPGYPLKLAVARLACAANVAVSISIWIRRDNSAIIGTLKVAGGQLAGIPTDVTAVATGGTFGWVISPVLTVTPTEAGVIEVTFEVYDGTSTSHNFWIDDLVIA